MMVSRWRKFKVSARVSTLTRSYAGVALQSLWLQGKTLCLCLLLWVGLCGFLAPSALAGLDDDHFDGNIFALYAGNGSLIPPKVSLEQSLQQQEKPTLLVLYVEDSRDCKLYASTISTLQSFYGHVANFVPINTDSFALDTQYSPNEPGYYYQGSVPQTVLFDRAGKVKLNQVGQVPLEAVDDAFREVFDLLPRSQSSELKRRSFNEFSAEMAQ